MFLDGQTLKSCDVTHVCACVSSQDHVCKRVMLMLARITQCTAHDSHYNSKIAK